MHPYQTGSTRESPSKTRKESTKVSAKKECTYIWSVIFPLSFKSSPVQNTFNSLATVKIFIRPRPPQEHVSSFLQSRVFQFSRAVEPENPYVAPSDAMTIKLMVDDRYESFLLGWGGRWRSDIEKALVELVNSCVMFVELVEGWVLFAMTEKARMKVVAMVGVWC